MSAATHRPSAVVLMISSFLAIPFESASGQEKQPVPAAGRPAVLFVADGRRGSAEYIRTWHDWLDAGFEVDTKPVAEIQSLDDLQPYNAIVINFLPAVDSERKVAPQQVVFEKLMDEYLRAGGGVVVFCGGGQWHGMSPAVCHLLAPYGASVPEEQIVDPGNETGHVLDGQIVCNRTTKIADAPMTRGITTVGYVGQASRADVIKLTMPLVVDDSGAWKVVVRGEWTAYSAVGLKPGTSAKLRDTPATYRESPTMAAYRTVGQGRLFVYPHNVAYTVTSPEVFENHFWVEDDLTKKDVPQNRSFIFQTLRWAAQPTLASGTFGGHLTDREFDPEDALALKPQAAIDWSKAGTGELLSPQMGELRGIVGAQSTFSGAGHSIEQLCAAARKAGLDFLAFTEKLEMLDQPDWNEIKVRCTEASDEEFLAMPGVAASDKVGNRWFGIGYVPLPQPSAVTPGGKKLDNTYSFYFKYFRTRLVGFVEVGQNPNPWFEMKQASCFGVYTSSGGSQTDDARNAYFASCYNMENYLPVDYHLVVTSVETCVGGNVTRTVIPEKLRWHEPEKLTPGDYVGVYPFGLAWGGAQYAVSDNLWAGHRQTHRNGFYLKLPQALQKGQVFDYKILYTTGGSLPDRPASDYRKAQSFLGLTGPFPALTDLTGGKLLETPVMATIQTTPESEVRFRTLKNLDDPIGLVVRIRGFNPDWQAAYLLDDSKTWRYFGQLDGFFYANFYTKLAAHRVVAGHPVTCDDSRLRIALDDPQGKQASFEVYNPTGEPIETRLKLNPTFFGQWKTLPASSIIVAVGPFTSTRVNMAKRRP